MDAKTLWDLLIVRVRTGKNLWVTNGRVKVMSFTITHLHRSVAFYLSIIGNYGMCLSRTQQIHMHVLFH